MKKLTAMLLALLLAAILCPAAVAEEAGCEGVWTLTGVEMNGMQLPPSILELSMTLTLNSEGAYTLSTANNTETGTWAAVNSTIVTTTADGSQTLYSCAGETLVCEDEGIRLLLTREGAAPAVPPRDEADAARRTGLALSDFNGSWQLTHALAKDTMLSTDALGFTLQLDLADGQCAYTYAEGSNTLQMELTCTLAELETGSTLTAVTTDADQDALTFTLTENGTLIWDASTEDMSLLFCFQPAPAAEE